MRQEEWDRTKRRALEDRNRIHLAGGKSEFDADSPWEFVIKQSFDQDELWWKRELEEHADAYRFGGQPLSTAVDGDAPVEVARGAAAASTDLSGGGGTSRVSRDGRAAEGGGRGAAAKQQAGKRKR